VFNRKKVSEVSSSGDSVLLAEKRRPFHPARRDSGLRVAGFRCWSFLSPLRNTTNPFACWSFFCPLLALNTALVGLGSYLIVIPFFVSATMIVIKELKPPGTAPSLNSLIKWNARHYAADDGPAPAFVPREHFRLDLSNQTCLNVPKRSCAHAGGSKQNEKK